MGWPQWFMAAWCFIEIGARIAQHGQPQTGTHNAWAAIIVYGVVLFVLYSGDFFKGSK